MPLSVLITGSSQGGMGDYLAQEYRRLGLQVFASARSLKKVQHLVDLGIEAIELDVTNQKSIDAAVEQVSKATGGKLDILVNNAGHGNNNPLSDANIEDGRKMFDVNFFGVIAVTKAFTPLLIAAKGKVVNNGSVAGSIPLPFQSMYNASKAALHMMTNALRMEMYPFGVQVVLVHTGLIKTNFFENLPDAKLPEDSIWLPAEAKIAEQRRALETGGSPAKDWAATVAAGTIKKSAPQDIWTGRDSWVVWFLTSFTWKGLIEFFIYKMNVGSLAHLVAR